jgi:hypothetical protein
MLNQTQWYTGTAVTGRLRWEDYLSLGVQEHSVSHTEAKNNNSISKN